MKAGLLHYGKRRSDSQIVYCLSVTPQTLAPNDVIRIRRHNDSYAAENSPQTNSHYSQIHRKCSNTRFVVFRSL